MTKITRKVKDDGERFEKLGLTTLLEKRMSGDLIETLKIMNCFRYSSSKWKFTVKVDLKKTKSVNQLNSLVNRVNYFWNKLLNQLKSNKSVKKKV